MMKKNKFELIQVGMIIFAFVFLVMGMLGLSVNNKKAKDQITAVGVDNQ